MYCAKDPKRCHCALLQLYQVGAPMERVAVDIAGILSVMMYGNRYIYIVMDCFTK